MSGELQKAKEDGDEEGRSDPTLSIMGSTIQVSKSTAEAIFGSSNPSFIEGLARQLVNVGSRGSEPDQEGTNFICSGIAGIKPRDELEGMMALQMAAIHNATMTFARRLAHVETIPQQDSAERALNKLTRTFALQVQTLQKYRSGGKQKVKVKHVHVNEGGQAIIGNVERGADGNKS